MNREARMKYLKQYLEALNRDVSDLPYNIDRFSIDAVPDDRGYGVLFIFTDEKSKEQDFYRTRWFPLRNNKKQIIAPMDVFDKFNTFVIERRAYK